MAITNLFKEKLNKSGRIWKQKIDIHIKTFL